MNLRRATQDDKPWINTIIAKEPTHHHTADFYFEPGTESHIIEDDGQPILIFRLNAKVIRVDIDFDPERQTSTGKALIQYFPAVASAAKKKDFRQLIFDSTSQRLIKFCEKRFNFRSCPDYVTEL
jgi:hypothetical protein